MYNNTEDEYKEAVKNEYEKVKNGQYSSYLSAPTRSKLSKLCWEIYEGKKMNQTDLNIFNALLGLAFDINNKNGFKAQKNKFRPIETFYKGETNPLEMDKVDLAAVLVDYQPRPFSRFRTSDLSLDYKKSDSSPYFKSDDEKEFTTEITTQIINEVPEKENPGNNPISNPEETSTENNFLRKIKENKLSIAAIICLLVIAIYFIFFNKGCMQWSDNHYEVVNCKEGIEGNPNEKIVYDSHLLDFKKIPVCDTTTWFANGKSIIWYAKSDKKVDFFTTCGNGRHPETGSTIKPVTGYILGKYKKPCASK